MRHNFPKIVITTTFLLVLFLMAACESKQTPVVEFVEVTQEVEITKIVEVTREVEVTVIVTATPTPVTPTPTPIPTATSTPLPIVDYSTEIVSFTTEDGYTLEGNLFLSEGNTAVVFAHMAGGDNDQQNWIPTAKQVAKRGFTSLTFNFRCYGNSECGGSGSGSILLSRDLSAAYDFLSGKGFERIVCIGASMGGRGCINLSFDRKLDGIVIVAGTGSSDPERQNLEDSIYPDMSKLFIVSKDDHITDRTQAMTLLYEGAPEPKTFITYPGSAHGTELLDTQYGQALRELLYAFLGGISSSE